VRPAGTWFVAWLCLILAAFSACLREPPRAGGTAGEPGVATSTHADAGVSPTDPGVRPTFDSLLDAAETVYFAGSYDSASALLREIQQRAHGERAVGAEARARTWLGLAAWRLGDYREARRIGEEALALKLTHGLTDQLLRSYNALGLLAWNENRFSDATSLFRKAVQVAGETGDRRGEATAAGNLALVQTELGNFAEARAGFLAMRATMGELGETRAEANALTNLGMLEIRLGDAPAAIPVLEHALQLYQSVGYATGTQSALGQLGVAYTALGEPGRAFTVLDSALRVARAQGLRQEEASNLEALAELYRDAGDHQRAILLYRAAQAINAELGLDVETGGDLRGEADIHGQLGDLERARTLAEQALAIHGRADARLEELRDRLFLAEILDRLGRSPEASAQLRASTELAKVLDARIARAEVALTRARMADKYGEARHVLQVTDGVKTDLARGGYAAEAEAQLLRARAYARLGKLDSAATAGRQALAKVERVRQNFGSGALRTAFVADQRQVYGELVSILLQLGLVDEAFETADRARGRTLLEPLTMQIPRPSRSASALAERETLLREIDQMVESLDLLEETPPSERGGDQLRELKQLHARLDTARTEYEALLIRAAETRSSEVALLGAAHVEAGNVQGALQPGQLLVEYLVNPDGSVLIFAVRDTGIRVVEAPITGDNLTSRVRLTRDLIARPSAPPTTTHGVLTGLHDVLMGPLSSAGMLDGVGEIVFVPHEVLNYLPFAALRDRATERYLMQDYTIRILPSAATLPALQARIGGDTTQRAVTSVLAPFPDRLPATRAEARAVAGAAAGVRLHVGASATETVLREALQHSGIVHVATHGVLNARNPMFSRLELARGESDEPADDGRLEIHELLRIRLNTPLVFLSGCETALGPAYSTRFVRGEDYATLAQAFLYGGARAVIATLWPVEDAGAAAFAERFYQELAASTPVKALAAAQRAMLLHPRYNAPYHWAAYQLAGDVEWAPPHTRGGPSVR